MTNADSCPVCRHASCACGGRGTSRPVDSMIVETKGHSGMANEKRWVRHGRHGRQWALLNLDPGSREYEASEPYDGPSSRPDLITGGSRTEIRSAPPEVQNKAQTPAKRGRPTKSTPAKAPANPAAQ